jgi:hypothetical protein
MRSYECGICSENMNPGNSRQYSLWQCRECYNVSHLLCVNTWWKSNGSQPRWSCPHCFHHFEGSFPNPSCWCGKQSFDLSNIASSRPNACLDTCDRIGQCRHGGREAPCHKLCHPGPCNIPCTEACVNLPLPQPPQRPQFPLPPRPPNAWNRFCTRIYGRQSGSIRSILWCFAMNAILCGAFSVLLFYYIKWWMRPYKYYEKARKAEITVVCVGCFVVLPVTAFFGVGLGISIADFLVPAFNLNSAERNREVKFVTKFFGFILLVGFCMGLWTLPIIG